MEIIHKDCGEALNEETIVMKELNEYLFCRKCKTWVGFETYGGI